MAIYNYGNIELLTNNLDIIWHKLKNNYVVTIVGDFNINMNKNSNKKQELLNFFNCYNIKRTIFENTRVTQTSASCIDGIYINIDEPYQTLIWDTHISDHKAQKITYKTMGMKRGFTWKRLFTKRNIEIFKTALEQEDWTTLYNDIVDANESFSIFYNIYLKIFNLAFPLQRIPINKKNRNNPKQISSVTQLKDRLDLLLILSQHNPSLKNTYKETKKQYDRELAAQKSKSFNQRITSSDNKNKAL